MRESRLEAYDKMGKNCPTQSEKNLSGEMGKETVRKEESDLEENIIQEMGHFSKCLYKHNYK